MQISYDPNVPAPAVLNEIKYYMACSVLKKFDEAGKISHENLRRANVAIAEQYGVLPYRV